MSKSVPDPPVMPIEDATRPDFIEPVKPMPPELEQKMAQVESQNLNGMGEQQERPYALPGEDEGPLGEGGQLRGPDAGGGGSS